MTNKLSITPAQQVNYALGEFAGLSSSVTGDNPDSQTLQLINSALNKAAATIGTWKVVWGPVVVQQSIGTDYALNTMYVAQSAAAPSSYTIAIAGTNPRSLFDWIIEDGFVHWQVPWVYSIEARGAKIALGTAVGLDILQTAKPSSQVPGSGATLRDFLATITGKPIELAVVGHSLGGALAPTLALWLADTQGFLSHWDPHKHATVSALPTAGPTAGNSEFAKYSSSKLGARLTPYYNTLDVVPHAWQASMLREIPALYVPNIPVLDVITNLINIGLQISSNGDYTTLPGLTPLAGTYKDVSGTGDLEKFFAELAYQHTTAYYPWFNFDGSWLPVASKPLRVASPALIAAASAPSPTPADVAAAISTGGPRSFVIGGRTIPAPTSPSDPRGEQAVAAVTAELQKHAGG